MGGEAKGGLCLCLHHSPALRCPLALGKGGANFLFFSLIETDGWFIHIHNHL